MTVICKKCKSKEDWEEITSNFVHDEPETRLYQCMNCMHIAVISDELYWNHGKDYEV